MTKEQLIKQLNYLDVATNIDLLEKLQQDTLETNKLFNLTAIKDEEKFRELMVLDSLYPLGLVDFDDMKVIDIGTGAGYPGLPLAICSKGEFTLLDSTKKKIDHINEFALANNISNVRGVNARAEEYAKSHREEYDIAIARAVSSLNILLELIIPLLKVGGAFIAMKGSKGFEEIKDSEKALKELGAEVVEIQEIELPESKEKRINILIIKTKETKQKYPREYKDIVNKPL